MFRGGGPELVARYPGWAGLGCVHALCANRACRRAAAAACRRSWQSAFTVRALKAAQTWSKRFWSLARTKTPCKSTRWAAPRRRTLAKHCVKIDTGPHRSPCGIAALPCHAGWLDAAAPRKQRGTPEGREGAVGGRRQCVRARRGRAGRGGGRGVAAAGSGLVARADTGTIHCHGCMVSVPLLAGWLVTAPPGQLPGPGARARRVAGGRGRPRGARKAGKQ